MHTLAVEAFPHWKIKSHTLKMCVKKKLTEEENYACLDLERVTLLFKKYVCSVN